MKRMELLAPAGGMDQLRAAILYGADAVYLATDRFGMRARATNFTGDELAFATAFAHENNVKVHLACNVLFMQKDIGALPAFFEAAQDAGVDALIIGDIGAFALARKYAPECELHVSTQASVANAESAKVWADLGAKRVVCAREMTLDDIAAMRREIPEKLEIEAFAHGAQCMAISGRCLISSYLTGRSANLGNCTQPCRWNYSLTEEKREGVHFDIDEDVVRSPGGDGSGETGFGTFILNAKDLNMIEHLERLQEAGVDSIKIEGRNKKAFYVATVVNAYRQALDALGKDGSLSIDDLRSELNSVSHRPFSTGFYFGSPEQACDFDGYEQDSIHVADVVLCSDSAGHAFVDAAGRDVRLPSGYSVVVRCRNRFRENDGLEVLVPKRKAIEIKPDSLYWLSEYDPEDPTCPGGECTGSAQIPSAEEAPDLADFTYVQKVDVANRSCNLYIFHSDEYIAPGSFVRIRDYRRSARHI